MEHPKRAYCIVFILCTLLPLAILPAHCAWASGLSYPTPLPKPDIRGDFSADPTTEFWEVIDPDPAGLSARRCTDNPYNPLNKRWLEVKDLPVSKKLSRGTILVCRARITDESDSPWFIAEPYGQPGKGCFYVRAHRAFIRPLHNPPPLADAGGNYRDFRQIYWIVVDEDPHGLNGRLHPDYPADLTDPSVYSPPGPVDQWAVVAMVPRGTILRTLRSHRGNIIDQGSTREPWILVTTRLDWQSPEHVKKGERFFVRLNRKYIQPVSE